MSKLGIGVIGVGTLGRRQAENLRRAIPAAQLIAVADADGGRAKQVASELEIQHHFDNVEDLLDREDFKAVVVDTPSRFLSSVRLLAVAAGLTVIFDNTPAL